MTTGTGRKRCCPLGSCVTAQDADDMETPKQPIMVREVSVPDNTSSSKDVRKSDSPVSSFVKGGVGLMVPATVDMAVAFTTSYWATYTMDHSGISGGYGLWKVWTCAETTAEVTEEGAIIIKENQSCQEKLADSTFPAWHIAMQVMMTISLAGMLSSFVMLLLYIFWSRWHRSKKIMSIIISISYFSGANLLVSLCVFGFKASEEIEMLHPTGWLFSWSFSLACTAFVMNQISASILITENKRLSWDNDSGSTSHDDDDDRDHASLLGLPIYVPEPRRAVFAPEGSVRVKDLKIGPPPKKVQPLEGVRSEPIAAPVERTGTLKDMKVAPPPKIVHLPPPEDGQSGQPFDC